MYWYLQVLRRYADFGGRSRRSEYWTFLLVNVVLYLFYRFLLDFFGPTSKVSLLLTIAFLLYGLALLVPGMAVFVRRLHDTGRSGIWALLGLVPIVGLYLIAFLVQDSQPGENRFGPNPKKVLSL